MEENRLKPPASGNFEVHQMIPATGWCAVYRYDDEPHDYWACDVIAWAWITRVDGVRGEPSNIRRELIGMIDSDIGIAPVDHNGDFRCYRLRTDIGPEIEIHSDEFDKIVIVKAASKGGTP